MKFVLVRMKGNYNDPAKQYRVKPFSDVNLPKRNIQKNIPKEISPLNFVKLTRLLTTDFCQNVLQKK